MGSRAYAFPTKARHAQQQPQACVCMGIGLLQPCACLHPCCCAAVQAPENGKVGHEPLSAPGHTPCFSCRYIRLCLRFHIRLEGHCLGNWAKNRAQERKAREMGALPVTLVQNHPRLLAAGLDVCREGQAGVHQGPSARAAEIVWWRKGGMHGCGQCTREVSSGLHTCSSRSCSMSFFSSPLIDLGILTCTGRVRTGNERKAQTRWSSGRNICSPTGNSALHALLFSGCTPRKRAALHANELPALLQQRRSP